MCRAGQRASFCSKTGPMQSLDCKKHLRTMPPPTWVACKTQAGKLEEQVGVSAHGFWTPRPTDPWIWDLTTWPGFNWVISF